MSQIFVLAAAVAIGACATQDEPHLQQSSASITLAPRQLRVMTWNVGFMEIHLEGNGIPIEIKTFAGDYVARAQSVAEGILEADPDVVVLQETFDQDAAAKIEQLLAPTYPHRVTKVGTQLKAPAVTLFELVQLYSLALGGGFWEHTPMHSGIQIYSKVPFAPLAEHVTRDFECVWEECVLNGTADENVGFVAFEDCAGEDCLSSKGAVLVKLDTPGPDTYVIATHMQAMQDEGHDEIRTQQLYQIRDLIEEQVPDFEQTNESFVFVGDINIIGGSAEWEQRFHPNGYADDATFACGGFPSCGNGRFLTDTWGFQSSYEHDLVTPADSPGDLGYSSGTERLDYIFHGENHDEQCVQHVRIAHEATQWETNPAVPLSDHLPLIVDLAPPSKWCSTDLQHALEDRAPLLLEFGPTDCLGTACDQDEYIDSDDGAHIDSPGSNQWFVIEQAGTYSIKVNDTESAGDVDFVVYHHDDMSRPLKPINEVEHDRKGFTFAMMNPPYYIQTFATVGGVRSRTVHDLDYLLHVHQHLCRKPNDACILVPNEPYPYVWPAQGDATIASVNELFFRFETGTVKGGHLAVPAGRGSVVYPDKRVTITKPDGCIDAPELQDYPDPEDPGVVPTWSQAPFEATDLAPDATAYTVLGLPTKVPDQLADYFLRVPRSTTRSCWASVLESQLLFETTLTWFQPGTLTCFLQSQDSGVAEDDHIRYDFRFDEAAPTGSCEDSCDWSSVHDEPLGDQVEAHIPIHAVSSLSGWYAGQMRPHLYEAVDDDADDELGVHAVLGLPGSYGYPLSPLPFEQSGNLVGDIIFQDPSSDPDYSYSLKATTNHTGPTKEGPQWPPSP